MAWQGSKEHSCFHFLQRPAHSGCSVNIKMLMRIYSVSIVKKQFLKHSRRGTE